MQDLDTLLTDFEAHLQQAVASVCAADDLPAHLRALAEKATPLRAAMTGLGEHCFETLTAHALTDKDRQFRYHLIHFQWAERAKQFLILWRDVLFQQQKGTLLRREGQLSEEALQRLYRDSCEVLRSAANGLVSFPAEAAAAARRQRGGYRRQVEQWRRQQNPWPVYRQQLSRLAEQCRRLQEDYESLLAIAETFGQVRELIAEMLASARAQLSDSRATARQTIAYFDEPVQPRKVAARLEDLEARIDTAPSLKTYTEQLEQMIDRLPEKMRTPVATSGGLVQYKEVSFRKSARLWLESEILPLLYEIGDLRAADSSGLRMSLVNIRNRALLLAAEMKEGKQPDFERSDFSQPLNAFLKKEQSAAESLTELETTVQQRLEQDFRLADVYHPTRNFLPLPLQSSINQLRINQGELLNRAQNWFDRQVRRIQQLHTTVRREEILSTSEKVVRLIRHRQGDESNVHYTSIFLTKGYIGESFWVGRTGELRHIKSLIDNWRGGFRGAVMITGQRFAGKSLFGDIVAQRYFPGHTIRLAPESVLELDGRRLTVGYDLAEALEFIRKYTVRDRYLVWIDDLERWWDPAVPLSRNVRALRRYIDNYANRLFFLVSMSNWLQGRLDRLHDIGKVFQAEINVSRMPEQDLREAILIRHGATHKSLVDEKGREVTPVQFRRMIRRIYQASEGNVGEALNKWAYSTRRHDEERVRHQYRSAYTLPDLVTPDNGLLLSAVMLSKRTNEYRLRKRFGPAFADKYGDILLRLQSVGLVTRQWDDWLEVNELTVNDVGRQLERKGYLRFHG